ncbi:LLM class flavin-dependent oxidoreductase [Peribacillus cavernae]|uniref:LLM class flavin-dependent oxidoreductase n=1 Tax=Peribacillus cavernae TaxID=1674310 RepID=A0A433HJF1_9BACI|nr:LLM class flavin-dependent oxidoreductase [Peribacillus cavernae]MDQ0219241.1 FMN-dependent oxidoreductase (nitrilotriacetate monooxygenase family) [Peribacillus cavernae]RUQ28546.1 LLM class flavin-dependent oxidoreductase [Peribacillus cavernae]
MGKPNRMLHLNLFLTSMGHHEAAWRHPKSDVSQALDFNYYKMLALKAEQAKLDSLFLADRYSVSKEAVKYGELLGGIEPLTLLSALAVVTKRIGLIATVSTTFNEPFNLSRRFASLDHLSGGRAGWNVITSGTDKEAQNFNFDRIPDHRERYSRAKEFVDVALKLWDSWEDDALIKDKASGIYADNNKIHEIHHAGHFFSVRGPLNISRSPQGMPVIVQAGSSNDGKEFAAQYAEVIFTAQQSLEDAQEFYSDIKSKVVEHGRSEEELKVLPGICPIIGESESEAKEKEAKLHELTNPEYSVLQLSNRIGFDLSTYPLDGPLPDLPDPGQINGHQSRAKLIMDLAEKENLTIRQLLLRLAGGRGHYTIAGTPKQIADELEAWFTSRAADGFNIMPQLMNEGFDDFVNLVVPELQRRGLFRTEYDGHTLRGHFGLNIPQNKSQIIG